MDNSGKKLKVYVISGLGAGANVFEKVDFGAHAEPVFLPYLIPQKKEDFAHYAKRMSEKINFDEPFYLVGYSFGGMIVQEINKNHLAKKVVLLGSIRSHEEKSKFFRFNEKSKVYRLVPMRFLTSDSTFSYAFFRRLYDKRLPRLFDYFTVRDPYYLKWSIHQVLNWKGEKQENVVQIMANKDAVFPIENSQPDYVIKNASHLFPVTRAKELSTILKEILV